MSDGPHKSLPLRHGYQRVAAWAYKPAFGIQQVSEAAEAALMRDVGLEVVPALKQLITIADGWDLLTLACSANEQLDRLRVDPSVQPLAASAIEATQMAISEGYAGLAAVERGLAASLGERLAAGARAMEEHYLVKAGPGACQLMRRRLGETIGQMTGGGTFSRMARSILGDRTVKVTRSPTVYDGVDQGPPL